MTKILFIPFSVIGGLLAGLLGKQLFAAVWSIFDEKRPPEPGDREASWRKVFFALLLQGAIFRASRGLADRAMRTAFSALVGAWPGEQAKEAR